MEIYYYAGPDTRPFYIIGVDDRYKLISKLWKPVDLTPEMLKDWFNYFRPRVGGYNPLPYGAFINGPNGERIGLWYSVLDWRLTGSAILGENNEVTIFMPTNEGHRQRDQIPSRTNMTFQMKKKTNIYIFGLAVIQSMLISCAAPTTLLLSWLLDNRQILKYDGAFMEPSAKADEVLTTTAKTSSSCPSPSRSPTASAKEDEVFTTTAKSLIYLGHRLGAPDGDKAEPVPGQIFYVTGIKIFTRGKRPRPLRCF